ncbi:MAG: hypothetical protein ABID54_13180 [Pseudomonadota bacterium]
MRTAVNWNLYNIADEDHSLFSRDPRSLETLQEAVAPGFDDDGNSLSNPLPPFHPHLSQFDSQIWEMCDLASPKVLMPHRDSSSIPWHYQLRPIMNMAGVDAEQAEIISEIGQGLDATASMMKQFCKQAKDDFRSFLHQMTPFVDAVDELEDPVKPKEARYEIPPSIRVNKGALKTLYRMLPDPDDEPDDEEEEREQSSTTSYHIMLDFSEIADMRRDLWDLYKDYSMGSPPYGLWDRIFKHDNEDYIPDDTIEEMWAKKFNWYRTSSHFDLFKQVHLGSLEEIRQLAKGVYEDHIKLSKVEKSVFFTEYNIRKRFFERHVKPVVNTMIQRIYNSDGRLGLIGIKLHQIQKGLIPFKYTLQHHEWGMLWDAYKQEKELRSNRAELKRLHQELADLKAGKELPQVPDDYSESTEPDVSQEEYTGSEEMYWEEEQYFEY